MIGYPALRKIISPDLGTTVTRTHKAFSMAGYLLLLFSHLFFIKLCTQHTHCLFPVAKLASFCLANNDSTSRNMCQHHFCFHFVYVLSTSTTTACRFHFYICGI